MFDAVKKSQKRGSPEKPILPIIVVVLALSGLILSRLHGYLLFHVVCEISSSIIAISLFLIVWNTRRIIENSSLLFIGIGYLFIAFIDIMHTLTYKGMGVFPNLDSNTATQFWIAARYMESITFLLAPIFFYRTIHIRFTLFIFIVVTAILTLSIFPPGFFPTCFVEGRGLTSFKIISEYIISLILLMSLVEIVRYRLRLDRFVFQMLVAAIILTILSEMFFTLYTDPYGITNMIGHLLKVCSCLFVYKALIETGLRKPYEVLFKETKRNEEALLLERDKLQKALEEIKTLRGIIPICATCKKIRDDEGAWNQMESYISKHSHAEFSHGICPECMKKDYPEEYAMIYPDG